MSHSRIVPLFNTNNFRDLGGYHTVSGKSIKWGRIYRSDGLHALSEQDQQKMVDLNIVTDIDLRAPDERAEQPDKIADKIQYLFNPVFTRDETKSSQAFAEIIADLDKNPDIGRKTMEESYLDMVQTDRARQALRTIFVHLLSLDDPQAVVFHCTAGKDRTGISAFLILQALGVDQATANKDYLLTNTTLKNFVRGKEAELRAAGKGDIAINNFDALWTAQKSYLNQALSAMQSQYGGVKAFIKDGLGISDHDLDDLKSMYLE